MPKSSPRRCAVPAGPASPRKGCRDPLILLLELSNGMLVNIEAAVNIAYGYDIRGEVLGETGTGPHRAANPFLGAISAATNGPRSS